MRRTAQKAVQVKHVVEDLGSELVRTHLWMSQERLDGRRQRTYVHWEGWRVFDIGGGREYLFFM